MTRFTKFGRPAESDNSVFSLHASSMTTIVPVLLYFLAATGLAVALLLPAKLLGPRRASAVKRMPYESGMDPIHDTRRRFDVRFHLVAIAFLVFDVELLFLYPWAVASQPLAPRPGVVSVSAMKRVSPSGESALSDAELVGPRTEAAPLLGINKAVYGKVPTVQSRGLVFGEAMTFIALLALGFAYAWRKGIFRWR